MMQSTVDQRNDHFAVFLVSGASDIEPVMGSIQECVGCSIRRLQTLDEFHVFHEPEMHGCLLVDARLSAGDASDLQGSLAAASPLLPVIVLVAAGDVEMAISAMQCGAIALLDGLQLPRQLRQCIEWSLRQDRLLLGWRAEFLRINSLLQTLTQGEQSVLNLMVDGNPTKAIASELGVSPNTVENHRASILRKLHANSVVDVARMVTFARTCQSCAAVLTGRQQNNPGLLMNPHYKVAPVRTARTSSRRGSSSRRDANPSS